MKFILKFILERILSNFIVQVYAFFFIFRETEDVLRSLDAPRIGGRIEKIRIGIEK